MINQTQIGDWNHTQSKMCYCKVTELRQINKQFPPYDYYIIRIHNNITANNTYTQIITVNNTYIWIIIGSIALHGSLLSLLHIQGSLLSLLHIHRSLLSLLHIHGSLLQTQIWCVSRTDLNECVTGGHQCLGTAVCVNLEGTYRCDCSPGFELAQVPSGYVCRGKLSLHAHRVRLTVH